MPALDAEYFSDSEPERELYHSQKQLASSQHAVGGSSTAKTLQEPATTGSRPAAKASFPWNSGLFKRAISGDIKGKGREMDSGNGLMVEAEKKAGEWDDEDAAFPPALTFQPEANTSAPSRSSTPSSRSSGPSRSAARGLGSNSRSKKSKRSSGLGAGTFSSTKKPPKTQAASGHLESTSTPAIVSSLKPLKPREDVREPVMAESPMRLDKVNVSRFCYEGGPSNSDAGRANLFRAGSYASRSADTKESPFSVPPASPLDTSKRKSKTSTTSGSTSESSLASISATANLLEIAMPTLRRLAACPSCNLAWTTYRAPSVKLSHISKCAHRNGLDSAAVLSRIRRAEEAKVTEEERKEEEERRKMTTFDRHVRMKNADVRVVGVDPLGLGMEHGERSPDDAVATSTQVQREIDSLRKAKRSRKAAGVTSSKDIGALAFAPRQQVSPQEDVHGLLADINGSVAATAHAAEQTGIDANGGTGSAPPATQGFPPSRLAAAMAERTRSEPLLDGKLSSLAAGRANGRRLWSLAGGDDDSELSRSVYRSRPSPPPSPISPVHSLSSASSALSRDSARFYTTRTGASSNAHSLITGAARAEATAEEMETPPRPRRSTSRSPLRRILTRNIEDPAPDASERSAAVTEGNSSVVMPDYAAWTIEQLIAESERLGFWTPPKTKRGLVQRAQLGWETRLVAPSEVSVAEPASLDEARPPSRFASRRRSRSSSRASGTSKASSASESSHAMADPDEGSDSSAESDLPSVDGEAMPDYKSWSLADLREAHNKLGFPNEPKTKRTLIARLTKFWLNERGVASTPARKAKTPAKPGRATADMVDEGMRRVCIDDGAFYERILRYEPIKLSVFRERLEKRLETTQIKASLITEWLDHRSITFYTEDPTSKRRRRP